jgi:hypothetical protein
LVIFHAPFAEQLHAASAQYNFAVADALTLKQQEILTGHPKAVQLRQFLRQTAEKICRKER